MAVSISNVDIATATFAGLVGTVNQTATVISNNAVTVDLSASGASVSGNGTVNGIFSSTTLKTSYLMGGNGTSTSNLSTLTLGFANSTTSSNVVITGSTTNVASESLVISSNTIVNTSTLSVTAVTNLVGNTTLKSNNTTTLLLLNGNTATSILVADIDTISITSSNSFTVNSSVLITGNTILAVNNSTNFLTATSNTSETAVRINAGLHVIGVSSFTGNTHAVSGNVAFNTDQLFLDNVDDRVGVFTNSPEYPVHIKYSNGTATSLRLDQNTFNTSLSLTSANAVAGNGVVIGVGNGNYMVLSTNSTSNAVTINANGSVVLVNSLTVGDTTVNGDVSISGNISVSGNTNVGNIYFSNVGSILSKQANLTFTASGTYQVVDSFDIDDYQSAKYTIQVQNIDAPEEVSMTEISMVTGYSNVHTVEYGTIHSNNAFVSFAANATTTAARLLVSVINKNTANNISVKLVRTNLS